jgi:hypothetical protein
MSVPSAPFALASPQKLSGSVSLRWEPPASNGGSRIRGYVVTCEGVPRVNLADDATECIVTGLDNHTLYAFQVSATNAYGSSPAAAFPLAQPASDTTGFQ